MEFTHKDENQIPEIPSFDNEKVIIHSVPASTVKVPPPHVPKPSSSDSDEK